MTATEPIESPVDEGMFAVASLCEAFQNTVARCGDMVALRTPGGAQEITWRGYGDRVRRIATGLASPPATVTASRLTGTGIRT